MAIPLHESRRSERGMSLIIVGAGFMALMTASMLAIDVGMLMTARSQSQNSADAGALAGAIALALNDYNDHSATGPAVTGAIAAAKANAVMGAAVSVDPADVEFLNDPAGIPDRVRVTVRRTSQRGNPLTTFIGSYLNRPTANVGATATAEAAPANAETCVKPFTIPDKWQERTTPPWDPDDEFDLYNNKGKPLAMPDIYIPPGQPGATGYDPDRDRGLRLTLKSNNQNKTSPSFYNPWDLPGSTGGDDYRYNIANCNTNIVEIGNPMIAEPGNMVGPTKQGTEDLIAKDPNAQWDTTCKCVKYSAFGISPRVVIIPLYDPVYYEEGKHNGRNADLKVANYLGFFIEEVHGDGEVIGRITPVTGLIKGNGPLPTGAFAKAIRLVE